jgi:hypothetical protein
MLLRFNDILLLPGMLTSAVEVTGQYRCHTAALTITVIIIIPIHVSRIHRLHVEGIQTCGRKSSFR